MKRVDGFFELAIRDLSETVTLDTDKFSVEKQVFGNPENSLFFNNFSR